MSQARKDAIRFLLKGIETGDPESVKVVNEDKYIQHNPQTHEGSEGLAALFARLSKTSPKVNVVRAFIDGDFFFGHTEYDFATRRIGFEVFRFEGEQVVEHWDNIQARKGPNPEGHSMVSGPTEVLDVERTDENRELIRSFIAKVFIAGHHDRISEYIDSAKYVEHGPEMGLLEKAQTMKYERTHRVLAEGNFVLAVNEGQAGTTHTSFYDLFRVESQSIVEHWDTIETIAPRSEWKNENGKF